jgi:hypothetical protein
MPRSHTVPDLAPVAPSGDHRTRPRRRGHALDRAILEAALAEIDMSGYAALSMERVAERARANKASLYAAGRARSSWCWRRSEACCLTRPLRPIQAACGATYSPCFAARLGRLPARRARRFAA